MRIDNTDPTTSADYPYKVVETYRYPEYNTENDPTSGINAWHDGPIETYTNITDDQSTAQTWNAGLYAITGTDVQYTGGITISGDVKLILKDGQKLTVSGMTINENSKLTVYGQSENTGKLIINGTNTTAALVGNSNSTLNVTGGVVCLNGTDSQAAISNLANLYAPADLLVQKKTTTSGDYTEVTNTGTSSLMPLISIENCAILNIAPRPAATGVTLSQSTANMTVGGANLMLTASVQPSTAVQTVTWESSNTNVATVSAEGVVTAVKGGTAIITAKAASDPTKTDACTVTVNDGFNYLDLESSTTDILESKSIDQNYTLTQNGDTIYNDKTKVKVEWTLPEISASFAVAKTWNPDTMQWDESKETSDIGEKTATFTFTNYSSVAVGAKVSFVKAIGSDSTLYTSDVKTINTGVGTDADRTYSGQIYSGQITHTYTPTASDFNSLSAGSGKYGIYTVSIVSAKKVSFITSTQNVTSETIIDDIYVGIGGKVTQPTDPTANGAWFLGWYKDADRTIEWNFNTDTVTEDTTLYAEWML